MSAPTEKKKKPIYEVEVDESGAIKATRVQPGKATQPRSSIVTSAVASSAPVRQVVEEDEEDTIFGPDGEILTGEARAKAIEEQLREAQQQQQVVAQVNDDELVYDNEGRLLTGEARTKYLANMARRNEEEEAKQKAEAEAVAKVLAEKKPRKTKKLERAMQYAITSGNDVEKMKMFYRFRATNPRYFVYTAEGNLQVKEGNAAGIPTMTIPLRAFSELRPEELEEIEALQKEEQEKNEKNYVLKLRELRYANRLYDPGNPESIANIVRLNEELRQASVVRNSTLYPEQWTTPIESIDTRDILLHLPYEERKLGYPVYLFKRFGLSRNDAEGHYREHGEFRPGGMEGGGTMVLFLTNPEDPKTGMFHPAAEREFVYNETRYVSPYQAYETERFKEFDDESMVDRLLGTRSAKTIRNIVSGEKRQPAFPIKLWEDILETFYTQFKDAAEDLKATGSSRFHMMDKLFGSPEYANALANVRTKLKEHEDEAPGGVDEVKRSVITEEQQKKDKVGAIINNFRRG